MLAAPLHVGEVRKGTTIPYVSHILGVASLAVEPAFRNGGFALLRESVQPSNLEASASTYR